MLKPCTPVLRYSSLSMGIGVADQLRLIQLKNPVVNLRRWICVSPTQTERDQGRVGEGAEPARDPGVPGSP